VLDDEAVMRFHALALPRLVAAGLADYRLLSIGGELAGAYLGLRDERRAYAYIGGMDPAFAYESPGAILLNAAISDAVARGAEEFHFLRGGEAYKYGWGAVDRRNRWRRLEPGGGDG
jgi:CelD/BcsL family acetyltransferase involved in cellulose biosynthesis